MSQFDKYDVFMKMLEIIEQDGIPTGGTVTAARVTQITNIIDRVQGNIVQSQLTAKEISMEGDRFENISQSIIATRGAIAQGVVSVRAHHGDDLADAIKAIEELVATYQVPGGLPDRERIEALELLGAIAQQGAAPAPQRTVLRSLGDAFWSLVQKAEPLAQACLAAWRVVERLWRGE